jgi:hypothetical protein
MNYMNKNLYKTTMDHIQFSGDFEQKAQAAAINARKSCKKARSVKTFLAAALGAILCLICGFGIYYLSAADARSGNLAQTVPSGTPSAQIKANPLEEKRIVIISTKYKRQETDSYKMPKPGTVIIDNNVQMALNDAANEKGYFYVSIHVIPPEQYVNSSRKYVYNGKSIGEWSELADLSKGEYPYNEYNGDHGGNITKEQWKTAQAQARKLDAQTNYDAAVEEYRGTVEPMLEKARKECEAAELGRLKKQGYDVFMADTWEYEGAGDKVKRSVFAGLLSKAQLLHFEADAKTGYLIAWVTNGDGIADWPG